jgi:two-component system, NarL family, invasion response regulator UvrY
MRVYLADDHALIREGLRRVLDEVADLDVVGEAGDVDTVLRDATRGRWDVLVLDLSFPNGSGFDVLADMRAFCPWVRVLVLSRHPASEMAGRVLAAGAHGYVTKGARAETVLQAIRAVGRGERYGVEEVATGAPHDRLSEREFSVLTLLGRGACPSAIADELGVAAATVSTYIARIRSKLGLRSVGEVVRYAVHVGLE